MSYVGYQSTEIPLSPLINLLDQSESSQLITEYINSFRPSSSTPDPPRPDIKTYPDASYHNYYHLGLSLCFLPPKSTSKGRILDSIDFFNPESSSSSSKPLSSRRKKTTAPEYTPCGTIVLHFPSTTINLPPPPSKSTNEKKLATTITRPPVLRLLENTTGKEIVSCLGEPSRKGGGVGWVDVWLEWGKVELLETKGNAELENEESEGVRERDSIRLGLMIHLRDPKGDEALTEEQKLKGVGGIWDRAGEWVWSSAKVFKAE